MPIDETKTILATPTRFILATISLAILDKSPDRATKTISWSAKTLSKSLPDVAEPLIAFSLLAKAKLSARREKSVTL